MSGDEPQQQDDPAWLNQCAALLGALPVPIALCTGPSHVFAVVNPAFQRLLGARQLEGRTVAEAMPELATQGILPRLDDARRATAAVTTESFALQVPGERGDDERCFQLTLDTLRTSSGAVGGLTVVATDVTDQVHARRTLEAARARAEAGEEASQRAARRLRVLADASGTFAEAGLDPRRACVAVVRYVAEVLGDGCMLALVDDDGARLHIEAGHHRDPAVCEQLRALEGHDVADGDLPARVFRAGEPCVLAAIDHATNPAGFGPLGDEMLGAFSPRSIAMVPLRLRARRLGVLGTFRDRPGPAYTAEDLHLLADLAERAALFVENARLYRHAQDANRTKDEFLATISHELRTPLTAILGWAAMVKSGTMEPERVTRALEAIERNARVQAQLVGDVLDVSRIVMGKLRLDLTPTDPIPVARAALDVVRPAAEAKGVRLEARLDPATPPVLADADRLQQVVWNLLTNAVKFTPAGGGIELDLRREGELVALAVRDDGEGITPEFLPHVFERFRQGDSSITRTRGGLGLGLSIVRHLVELHGGTVTAESAGAGRGSRFTVRLPVPLGAGEEALVPSPSTAAPVASGSGPASGPRLPGVRILVVEDEPDARELLGVVFEDEGAEVATAGSAAEALEILASFRPDVLVSDIGLPDEDGYDLIRQVRSRDSAAGGRTPAVALTAYVSSEDARRAIAAGYQRHAAKPIEPSRLIELVADLGAPPGGVAKTRGRTE